MIPNYEQEDWFKQDVTIVEANSAEWLELRKNSIGASEIGTVLDLNPFETRHQLWLRKTGQMPDTQMNFRMKAGHYFEDAIARMADDHYDAFLSMYSDIGIRRHRTMPFLTCSLDRWGMQSDVEIVSKGPITDELPWYRPTFYVLDCKNVGVSSYRKIKDADRPPVHYWLQVQQQMLVTSHNIRPTSGYLLYWAGGQMLKMYEIKPSKTAWEIIEDLGQQFYECMKKMTDPYKNMFGYDNLQELLNDELFTTSKVVLRLE